MPEREELRATFSQDAARYDRARPGYPPALFEDLRRTAGLGPGSRVLEIGPGTGQATVPLAELGCTVVAVELGPELAAVARRRLSRYPAVEVVAADVETWPLPAEPFDLVFAATAFHWLDPATRVTWAAGALRAGGVLATADTRHVAGGTDDFFRDVQGCYERFDPATPRGLRLPAAADVPEDRDEIDRSGRFAPPEFHRYGWELTYRRAEYLDLLGTYSGHRALPAADLAGLLDCVGRLIDDPYGGGIVKRHLTVLRTARRTG